MKKIVFLLYMCSMLTSAFAEQRLTHKCADFVALSTDEEVFGKAMEKHVVMQDSLKGSPEKIDPEYCYPIWKNDSFNACGQQFERALVMLCWFKSKKRFGIFYFEGYSQREACQLMKSFDYDFPNSKALDSALMYDGLLSWEVVGEAFPRLFGVK